MKKVLTQLSLILFFLIIGFIANAEIKKELNLKFYKTNSTSLRPFPNGLPVCQQTAFRELEKLYDATNGDSWTDHTNWFSGNNLAQWAGIALTPDGCDVQIISLGFHNLAGSLPTLNLPQLSFLYLAGNKLSGSIPTFNSTSFTTIDLSSNQFSGSIPNLSLPFLTSLQLSNNQLTGNVPNFNTPKLKDLSINQNQLSGDVPNFYFTLNSFFLTFNKFIFGDFTGKNWLNTPYLQYAYQAKTPTAFNPSTVTLSVFTGEAENKQLFKWFKDGILVASTQSSSFRPTVSGTYNCEIISFDLSSNFDINRHFILQSLPVTVKLSDGSRVIPSGLASCLTTSYNALEKIYDTNNGANWLHADNWFTGSDLNSWYGVTLTADGCNVAGLNLKANNLSGSLPSINLSQLISLDISQNNLSGSMPNLTSTLQNFNLDGNKFIFGDLIGKNWLSTTNLKYAPQAKIRSIVSANVLKVSTGQPDYLQEFSWFKNGILKEKTFYSTYVPTESGKYYVEVRHSSLTNPNNANTNLVLTSFEVDVAVTDPIGLHAFPTDLPDCLKISFRELEKIYDYTSGGLWKNHSNWFTSGNMSTWYGVTLTTDGCDIAALDLSDNNLLGNLPLEYENSLIGLGLPKIVRFDVSKNKLNGLLPNYNFPNLEVFNVSNNLFSGKIPNFKNLVRAKTIDLNNNQLTDTIPNFKLPNLIDLNVSKNQLKGTIPDFLQCPKLKTFNFSNNFFIFGDVINKNGLNSQNVSILKYATQAKIAISYAKKNLSVSTGDAINAQQYDWYLNDSLIATTAINQYQPTKSGVYYCKIKNSLLTISTDSMRNWILQSFNISVDAANGLFPFPKGLPVCLQTSFRELEKLYNATNGDKWNTSTNWFTNSDISSWYGVILTDDGCGISEIDLNTNNLVGTLPILNLPQLTRINFNQNSLTGSIPNLARIGSLPSILPNLKYLYLNRNQFSGTIPNLYLPSLIELEIKGNKLSGSIPNFNLPNLQEMLLYGNQLSGFIPNFNTPQLITLDLGSNQLQGSVPNFTAPLQSLYLDDNGSLAGSIPNFSSASLNTFWLSGNKFNFGDIANKSWLGILNLKYAPQAKINLSFDKGVLSVATGEPDNVQRFDWFLNGKFLQITSTSQFVPIQTGTYFCRATHKNLTLSNVQNKNLVLQSFDYAVTATVVSDPDNGATLSNFKQPNSNYNFSIFPNPAQDDLSIIYRATTDGTLNIYDMLGREKLVQSIKPGETDLDVSDYTSGIYLVQIVSGYKKTNQTFIKN